MVRKTRSRMFALAILLLQGPCHAFESDVHFGLSRWLAIKAGFTTAQADLIAVGDRRSDSGMMDSLEFVLQYACLGTDDDGARTAQHLHYPSATPVPAAPAQRAVVAGSEAARKGANEMILANPSQSGFLLLKLGEALHRLQDSWSHQGVPSVPATGHFECDALRASAHPIERGGWSSHKADITRHWPQDTRAMAEATYQILTRFPAVDKVERKPEEWSTLHSKLDGFIKAATKTQKGAWFAAQGFSDLSFLEGISLPDGAERWTQQWMAHRLPPLTLTRSEQRPIASDILEFFNGFFSAWSGATDFDELAAQFGRKAARRELAARLKLWRFRDHGRMSDIAHSSMPLTSSQVAEVNRIGADPRAYVKMSLAEGFFPMMAKGADVQPLYPFLVESPSVAAGANPRAIAMAKLRHAPYDSLAFVAEKIGDRWQLVAVTATIDH